MTKILLSIIIFIPTYILSQNTAKIKLDIKNIGNKSVNISYENTRHRLLNRSMYILLNNDTGSINLSIRKPSFISINYVGSDFSKIMTKQIFVSPGDSIVLYGDYNKPNYAFKIKGKGKLNNEFVVTNFVDNNEFINDSLPNKILKYLKEKSAIDRDAFYYYAHKKYVSKDFLELERINQRYRSLYNYISFLGEKRLYADMKGERLDKDWDIALDSMIKLVKFSNDDALKSPVYIYMITTFIDRKNEELAILSEYNPSLFYRLWYKDISLDSAKKMYSDEKKSLMYERIINKYFSGKTKEFLYAYIIPTISNSDPKNTQAIFRRFKYEFPKSVYDDTLTSILKKVENRMHNALSDKIIFVANSTKIKTFKEVLDMLKGNTILLDMWGTWCLPCLEDIEKNSELLRKHFEGKDNFVFLYIANYDSRDPENWKEKIAFYNMKGMHILANDMLTKDIMKAVNSSTYPTLIIIRKDGTYELSKAGHPTNIEVLINQIEENY